METKTIVKCRSQPTLTGYIPQVNWFRLALFIDIQLNSAVDGMKFVVTIFIYFFVSVEKNLSNFQFDKNWLYCSHWMGFLFNCEKEPKSVCWVPTWNRSYLGISGDLVWLRAFEKYQFSVDYFFVFWFRQLNRKNTHKHTQALGRRRRCRKIFRLNCLWMRLQS